MVTLDESYRVLELKPGASDDEVRRAHHDLSKVWHPDRFAHDPALRQKAEEKLKTINQAFETIRASREGGYRPPRPAEEPDHSWRLRFRGREIRVAGLEVIILMVDRGHVGEDAEIFDPRAGRWAALDGFAELRNALTRRRLRHNRTWALTCAFLAILILLRRPTPAFLAIAVILFVVAFVFLGRMRQS
jgi:hypothetical protein